MNASTKSNSIATRFKSGSYWNSRSDLLYYKYVDYLIRVIGAKSKSIIDVGSGGSPYLEWFDWIGEKASVDIVAPYSSESVTGITANIMSHDFGRKFELCTCLQVLEHVEDPTPFARRLFEIGEIVVISVPYKWPAGKTENHIHDPVDEQKLEQWTGRRPNLSIIATEFFSGAKSRRLISAYHPDPAFAWDKAAIAGRILRKMGATHR